MFISADQRRSVYGLKIEPSAGGFARHQAIDAPMLTVLLSMPPVDEQERIDHTEIDDFQRRVRRGILANESIAQLFVSRFHIPQQLNKRVDMFQKS